MNVRQELIDSLKARQDEAQKQVDIFKEAIAELENLGNAKPAPLRDLPIASELPRMELLRLAQLFDNDPSMTKAVSGGKVYSRMDIYEAVNRRVR